MAEGSQTSISVEPDFWEQFRLIVIERRTTISNLLAEIERTMRLLPDQGKGCDRTLTLSAAVRVFVLRTVMAQSSSQRGARRRTARAAADPTPGANPDASSDKPGVSHGRSTFAA
jgi:predicted DNA-binding ribbon-helix-helix protein